MIRDRHDARPRIHIRRDGERVSFSLHPRGRVHDAASLGEAVERAVHAVEGRDAVIIYEGGNHVDRSAERATPMCGRAPVIATAGVRFDGHTE